MKKASILLAAHENSLCCSALCELLSQEDSIETVFCDNSDSALTHLENQDVSLIIYFVNYPLSPLIHKLTKLSATKVKLLLVFDAKDTFAMLDLSRFPVHGMVSTAVTFQELKAAIRIIVFKNLKYISPCLLSASSAFLKHRSVFSFLSEKELDVAMAILSGKRNGDIAAELNISHKTVSTYRTRIFKKLNIDSDLQLYIYAHKNEVLNCANHEVTLGA